MALVGNSPPRSSDNIPFIQNDLESPSNATLINTIATNMWYGFSTVCDGISYVSGAITSTFIDDKAPWKQEKYQLLLKRTADRLNNNDVSSSIWNESIEKIRSALTKHSDPDTYPDMRGAYLEVTDTLRLILESPEWENHYNKNSDPGVQYILDLCYVRFAQIPLLDFAKKVIVNLMNPEYLSSEESISSPSSPLSSEDQSPQIEEKELKEHSSPLNQPLKDQFSTLDYVSTTPMFHYLKNKISATGRLGYDPIRQSNTPCALFNLSYEGLDGTPLNLRFLRTGTPTRETRAITDPLTIIASEAPEFRGFLQALAKKNPQEKVIFFLLQDLATEGSRIDIIKEYQRKFPEIFRLYIVCHDSEFYYQNGNYNREQHTEGFQALFFYKLFEDTSSGYDFSLIQKEEREIFKILIQQVCEDLFPGKEHLQPDEKRSVIQTVHARLPLLINCMEKANFAYFCCRDTADRAGINYTVTSDNLSIKLDQQEEHESIINLISHFAPFFAKKTSMINPRRERLEETKTHQANAAERIRARKDDVYGKITNLQFILSEEDIADK